MASSTRNSDSHDGEIRLWREGEWWIARDVETGVTSQGTTREAALDNLDEAVAAHEGEGRKPTDDELRDAGIDPADNTTGDDDRPEILQ